MKNQIYYMQRKVPTKIHPFLRTMSCRLYPQDGKTKPFSTIVTGLHLRYVKLEKEISPKTARSSFYMRLKQVRSRVYSCHLISSNL